MPIPPLLLRTLLWRGAFLWIMGRLALMANLSMAKLDGGPLLPFWCVIVTALICLADLHRRKEIMLLRNLGLHVAAVIVIACIPALLLETALAVVR